MLRISSACIGASHFFSVYAFEIKITPVVKVRMCVAEHLTVVAEVLTVVAKLLTLVAEHLAVVAEYLSEVAKRWIGVAELLTVVAEYLTVVAEHLAVVAKHLTLVAKNNKPEQIKGEFIFLMLLWSAESFQSSLSLCFPQQKLLHS